MRKLLNYNQTLKDRDLATKVYIYCSTKTAGDDYDAYEKNYVTANLNPFVIKGYVTTISPEALVYKQYGLHNMGAIELICEDRYENALKICNKIVIDDVEYQVFREATGNKAIIQKRPYHLLRAILNRKG
jgi:hypothetical protein